MVVFYLNIKKVIDKNLSPFLIYTYSKKNLKMIKKFKKFINKNKLIKESFDIKTEYQIHHLNREEKIKYFEERFYSFENSDFDDLNIQIGRDENGYRTEYFPFTDYEFSLCPKLIKDKYIQICINKGLGIPINEIENLKPNQKKVFLDSCAKNARQSYVRLNIMELFSDEQLSIFIDNFTKNHHHLSNKQLIFLSDKFKKFYIDKIIYYNSRLSKTELDWIEPKEDRVYYTNYYINTCIEKGGKLDFILLDTLTDEQKLVYYKNQVEKGNIDIAYRGKIDSDESIEFDKNQYELDRLKNKLNK